MLTVAALTLANSGDNIGVYVPVFTTTDTSGLLTYVLDFLVLVAIWVRRRTLLRQPTPHRRSSLPLGHILLPVVLIGIGRIILIKGHAFGL